MSTITSLDTLKINYLTQAQYDTALTNNEINENEIYMTPYKEPIVDLIYPVGSIYMSVNNISPATFLEGTTWEPIQDRFLLAAGSTYTAGETGGAATVTLTAAQSGVHQHTHSFTQPTVNGGAVTNGITGGSHHHVLDRNTRNNSGTETGYGYTTQNGTSKPDSTLDSTHTHTLPAHTHSVSGGAVGNTTAASATEAHNNMPPYLTVYMWKRTA